MGATGRMTKECVSEMGLFGRANSWFWAPLAGILIALTVWVFCVNVVAAIFLLPFFFFFVMLFFLNAIFDQYPVAQLCNYPPAIQITDSCATKMSSYNFALLFSFLFSCQCATVVCVNWGVWRKHMGKAKVLLEWCWSTACLMYASKRDDPEGIWGATWMIWAVGDLDLG